MTGTPKGTNLDNKTNHPDAGVYDSGLTDYIWAEDWNDLASTVNYLYSGSSNWDTAYGWGDHASAGYLTTLTGHNVIELDDVSSAGSGQIITSTERTKLNGIETGATADQTQADIESLGFVTGSHYTDADVESYLTGLSYDPSANTFDSTVDINAGSGNAIGLTLTNTRIRAGIEIESAGTVGADGILNLGINTNRVITELTSQDAGAWFRIDTRSTYQRFSWFVEPAGSDTETSVMTLAFDGTLTLINGTGINEFSTDGTLGGNSDSATPTEKAVKTYVDANAGDSLDGTYYHYIRGTGWIVYGSSFGISYDAIVRKHSGIASYCWLSVSDYIPHYPGKTVTVTEIKVRASNGGGGTGESLTLFYDTWDVSDPTTPLSSTISSGWASSLTAPTTLTWTGSLAISSGYTMSLKGVFATGWTSFGHVRVKYTVA